MIIKFNYTDPFPDKLEYPFMIPRVDFAINDSISSLSGVLGILVSIYLTPNGPSLQAKQKR